MIRNISLYDFILEQLFTSNTFYFLLFLGINVWLKNLPSSSSESTYFKWRILKFFGAFLVAKIIWSITVYIFKNSFIHAHGKFFFSLMGAYLLGSIPSSLILTRLKGLKDIRQTGSGNIGATNVLRTGHKALAAVTLILDGLKGYGAIIIFNSNSAFPEFAFILGIIAVVGHIFPWCLDFKGGKGVATALGVFIFILKIKILCIVFLWIIIASIFQYSSVASLVSLTMATPLYLFSSDIKDQHFYIQLYGLLISIGLIWFRHIENIIRLFHHQENKIRFFKKGKSW